MYDQGKLINVDKGKTSEGYPKCQSARLVAGEQINDSLRAKYYDQCDYRLPRGAAPYEPAKR